MRHAQSNLCTRVAAGRYLALAFVTAIATGCPTDPDGAESETGDSGTSTNPGTTSDTPTPATSDGSTADPSDSGRTTTGVVDSSSDDDGSGESSGTGGSPVDCSNLPETPVEVVALRTSTPSEDFTFDGQGNMLGVGLYTGSLTATRYDGTATTILPNVSEFGRGVRVLPNGDYLAVDPGGGGVLRITPEGSMMTILPADDEPNGLAMHPNGMAYLTSGGGRLRRFDPDTGDVTILTEGPSLDGIAFNLDYSLLYYNTEGGDIYQLSMDEDGMPTGEPSVFVTVPVMFILDGMTLDECDNLYVVDMVGVVWRISPAGDMEVVVEVPPATMPFIAAINFGSGEGGWDAEHMYVMDLGLGVSEADLGVRGRPLPYPLP